MGFGKLLSVTDISASGLSAERTRMEVVANNISNANSTQTPEGGPFRRKEVVFASAVQNAFGVFKGNVDELSGVRVVGIQSDSSELPVIYRPGHPEANQEGYVTMPNVSLPEEMVDLVTASRSYEANLRALKTFRDMVEQALSLLRGR